MRPLQGAGIRMPEKISSGDFFQDFRGVATRNSRPLWRERNCIASLDTSGSAAPLPYETIKAPRPFPGIWFLTPARLVSAA